MKLKELLVQELPKRGGWPEGAQYCWQDFDKEIRPSSAGFGFYTKDLAENHRVRGMANPSPGDVDCVTREQYEAALAAAQPQWDGNGLPPVGCECEIAASTLYLNITHPEGAVVKIYSHFTDDRGVELAAFVDAAGKVGGVCTAKCFRPIRSEVDKKRDEAVAKLTHAICGEVPDTGMATAANYAVRAYDAIAAGKIPHVHIE